MNGMSVHNLASVLKGNNSICWYIGSIISECAVRNKHLTSFVKSELHTRVLGNVHLGRLKPLELLRPAPTSYSGAVCWYKSICIVSVEIKQTSRLWWTCVMNVTEKQFPLQWAMSFKQRCQLNYTKLTFYCRSSWILISGKKKLCLNLSIFFLSRSKSR